MVRKAVVSALFALLLVGPAQATTGQGLYGLVTRGPTVPVCSTDEPCSEPAARTKLQFLRAGKLVATVVTDSQGRYRVRLPRGLYSVRLAGVPATAIGGRIAPAAIRVCAVWRRQNLDIDTGIR